MKCECISLGINVKKDYCKFDKLMSVCEHGPKYAI